jgi:hypothetical protein
MKSNLARRLLKVRILSTNSGQSNHSDWTVANRFAFYLALLQFMIQRVLGA